MTLLAEFNTDVGVTVSSQFKSLRQDLKVQHVRSSFTIDVCGVAFAILGLLIHPFFFAYNEWKQVFVNGLNDSLESCAFEL